MKKENYDNSDYNSDEIDDIDYDSDKSDDIDYDSDKSDETDDSYKSVSSDENKKMTINKKKTPTKRKTPTEKEMNEELYLFYELIKQDKIVKEYKEQLIHDWYKKNGFKNLFSANIDKAYEQVVKASQKDEKVKEQKDDEVKHNEVKKRVYVKPVGPNKQPMKKTYRKTHKKKDEYIVKKDDEKDDHKKVIQDYTQNLPDNNEFIYPKKIPQSYNDYKKVIQEYTENLSDDEEFIYQKKIPQSYNEYIVKKDIELSNQLKELIKKYKYKKRLYKETKNEKMIKLGQHSYRQIMLKQRYGVNYYEPFKHNKKGKIERKIEKEIEDRKKKEQKIKNKNKLLNDARELVNLKNKILCLKLSTNVQLIDTPYYNNIRDSLKEIINYVIKNKDKYNGESVNWDLINKLYNYFKK